MNNNWGSFSCPQCNNNKIEENDDNTYISIYNNNTSNSKGYQYWMNRKIFIKKEPKTEWIFYKEKDKKWNCCSCCNMCKCFGEGLIFCCTDRRCDVTLLCYPCSFIFYILLCFICDLCSFLCFGKMTYFGVKGKNSDFHLSSKVYDDNNIWDEMGGLTEEEMNKKKKWLCSNCKYYNKSFTDFIPKNNINNINNTNINNNNINDNNSHNKIIPNYNIHNDNNQGGDIYNNIISFETMKNAKNVTININNNASSKTNRELNEDTMAINFKSIDQTLNYCIPCKKSDKFYAIERKLYEEYPQYKNKQVYFTGNGNRIDKNKTLEENKIKSGDTIILNLNYF